MKRNHQTDIDLIAYLASHQIHPVYTRNHNSWFNSPLRNESTPSFKVDIRTHLWYDFGLGEGGNALTFVSRFKCVDNRQAYQIVTQDCSVKRPNFSIDARQNAAISPLKILKASQSIDSLALIAYLRKRGIDYSRAQKCPQLHQIEYSVNDKVYFALGFINDKGGYEIRNAYWKGASSPKSITTIPGETKNLNVFEGFMDYLSALTYYQMNSSKHNSIVLNGVGQTEKLLSILPQYHKVFLFIDNDDAGKKVVERVMQHHKRVSNISGELYSNFKDFNEYLMSHMK
jgi:DNA primase